MFDELELKAKELQANCHETVELILKAHPIALRGWVIYNAKIRLVIYKIPTINVIAASTIPNILARFLNF